ncbi:MAG TPA: hypothetical protein VFQ60_01890 [Patescibacteria group bacterium]|nr:hypothetical protein [Patescibacteria group bacterium]
MNPFAQAEKGWPKIPSAPRLNPEEIQEAEAWEKGMELREKAWKEIDHDTIEWLKEHDPERAGSIMDWMETLRDGMELSRQSVGEPGKNPIEFRQFQSKEAEERGQGLMLSGYFKPQQLPHMYTEMAENGKTRLVYDQRVVVKNGLPKTERRVLGALHQGMVVHFSAKVDKGKFSVRLRHPITKTEEFGWAKDRIMAAEGRQKFLAPYTQGIARYYGISERQTSLPEREGRFTYMMGMEPERLALNEAAFSRMGLLLGAIDEVPVTVLRKESNQFYSGQEAKSAKKMKKLGPMTSDQMHELARKGEAFFSKDQGGEEERESFMKLAILDYLFGSMDRHGNNFFYDVERHRFYGIDNGLSFGFQMQSKGGRIAPVNRFRSVPIGIVLRHPDWKLKDQTFLARLTNIRDRLAQALQGASNHQPFEIMNVRDPAVRLIHSIFTELYRTYPVLVREKLVSGDMRNLLARLDSVIEHKRPPFLSSEEPNAEFLDDLQFYRLPNIPPIQTSVSREREEDRTMRATKIRG